MDRRAFLRSTGGLLLAAPALIRPGVLMPVRAYAEPVEIIVSAAHDFETVIIEGVKVIADGTYVAARERVSLDWTPKDTGFIRITRIIEPEGSAAGVVRLTAMANGTPAQDEAEKDDRDHPQSDAVETVVIHAKTGE